MSDDVYVPKPEVDADFSGLMQLMQTFESVMTSRMKEMYNEGVLDGWDNPANEKSFQSKLDAETVRSRRAVYEGILANYKEDPESTSM